MATLHQVMALITSQVEAATTGLMNGASPVSVTVAEGRPPLKVLQAVPKGGPQIIGVYDRKIGRDSTRWLPEIATTTVVPATLTTTASADFILPLGSATITLGGTVTKGDAVSAVFISYAAAPQQSGAEVAIGAKGSGGSPPDTPTTMAAALAAQINADTLLSTWVFASAAGPVVTLVNRTSATLSLASYAGNGGSQVRELGRRNRQLQILCWTRTETLREIVTDPIDAMIAAAETDTWLALSDGTPIRVTFQNDYYCEEETLADIYRRDFFIDVDYPVSTTDLLYAVLAPVIGYTPP